ncbi:hypothetical protein B9W68_03820 [Streptomyces sp. CS227]|uniref:hypothetical protein n=1 Tax=Streptomyces sp. CS227 TaxID=1982763 RepID=UPI000B4179A5|nr:hypothetical protein [Streptomyces sp. CS227]OWA19609.1 hypothetical protein B9W68_03820 [Streptomyces sp. CS227]
MSENTLRHFLLKHFGEPQEETAAGDTEMAEAEELVPVKEESPEPGPSTVSFDHPAVTGYTVVVDAYGQRLYQEDDTGDLCVRDPRTGRTTYLEEDVEMAG